jgi:hypothetical protein
MKAAYRPTKGSTPATKANATASGTRAKATVRPLNTSFFTLLDRLLINSIIYFSFLHGKNKLIEKDSNSKRALFKVFYGNNTNKYPI